MNVTVPEYNFPVSYNDNYLVLMVRDPNCIFAYWEFSNEQKDLIVREFACTWGEVPLMMRVYDLTGLSFNGQNAHSYFDLAVHPLADNFYVKDVKPNHSYCVELGINISTGRFMALLRSNVVQTPRDSLADGSGAVMADLLDRLTERKAQAGTLTFSSEGVYGAEQWDKQPAG